MTQKELAEILNISQQAVGKWEKGLNEPDSKTILRLSEIFNCSLEYLHGLTDVPTPYNIEKELTPREHLQELFKDDRLKDKELAFKNFDELDDDDINAIIEYIEARYLLAEKRKKNDSN